jgi:hypothetical protein
MLLAEDLEWEVQMSVGRMAGAESLMQAESSSIVVAHRESMMRAQVDSSIVGLPGRVGCTLEPVARRSGAVPRTRAAEPHTHNGTEDSTEADNSTDTGGNSRAGDNRPGQLQFRFQWEGQCQF